MAVVAASALAPLGFAQANSVPTEVQTLLAQPRLHGEGTLRFLGFRIYQASLWTEAGFDPQRYSAHRFALSLRYLREFDGADIADRSLEEMRRAGPLPSGAEPRWGSAMRRSFPKVQDGDQLTGLHQPGAATAFYFNGQPRPPVDDPAFGPAFFGIWLGPTTSEPDLRRQLLKASST
jgi:hypothetical protein